MKDVTDTLPDDYPTEELRGRDVSYHVTTLRMKEQELPELNDEFAKTMGEYETVDALRECIEKNLRERLEQDAESEQVDEAIRQLQENATVEIPGSMVKEELDDMLKRLETRLREQSFRCASTSPTAARPRPSGARRTIQRLRAELSARWSSPSSPAARGLR